MNKTLLVPGRRARTLTGLLSALAVLSALGCANGDGRGFGTVDGTLRVAFDGTDFTTKSGKKGSIDRATITVAGLDLRATTPGATGTSTQLASFAVGSSFGPLAGDFALPFGPFEVNQGAFSELVLHVARIELEGEADGKGFTIVAEPEAGAAVASAADLPVDENRAPNITLAVTLTVGAALLEGLDPTADGVSDEVSARVRSVGRLDATWSRKAD